MARPWRLFRNLKAIVGVALIGLGLFIFCGNLADVAARSSRLVGISTDASQTFGGLIAVGLAAAQVWRSYVFDRRELALGVCRILISFWPVLLVIAGAVLTGTASRATSKNIQNKNTEGVELTGVRSTRQ
jgi:uncharacterized membrane protein